MKNFLNQMKAVMIGHAVGDALGVPVEFCSRDEIAKNPVTDMNGYGTYPLPAGAWSDDTSMSLCALDSLAKGTVDYDDIMENFVRWVSLDEYTPTGEMFDIGRTCLTAIRNYLETDGKPALECGLNDEHSNGNGSLMRIHPFALYTYAKGMKLGPSLDIIHEASAITHAHTRSKLGCAIYSMVLWGLLEEPTKERALKEMENALVMYDAIDLDNHYWAEENQHNVKPEDNQICTFSGINEVENYLFASRGALLSKKEDDIQSTGYVVHTLEAALWCLLTTDNYRDCVLKAVNLGEDTDTVAAVAGGLAGAMYGYDAIPKEWRDTLIKREYIEEMCERASANWTSESKKKTRKQKIVYAEPADYFPIELRKEYKLGEFAEDQTTDE